MYSGSIFRNSNIAGGFDASVALKLAHRDHLGVTQIL